jgi:Saxitoxin biosynthesis operon protein SxtJ
VLFQSQIYKIHPPLEIESVIGAIHLQKQNRNHFGALLKRVHVTIPHRIATERGQRQPGFDAAIPLKQAFRSPSMNTVSPPKLPSERSFGLMLAAVLAILGIRGIIGHRSPTAYGICLAASVVCGLFALTSPKALAPLNKAWFYLGKGMGKIISPIVLAIIFWGILTPVAIVTRLFGRDELRLKRRANNSYWIDRTSPVVAAHSFKNQF